MDFKDSELSLVDLLVFGKKKHSTAHSSADRRNTMKLDDGTELVTGTANYEDLNLHGQTDATTAVNVTLS